MELDAEKLLKDGIRSGIHEAIKNRFSNTYNNPLDKHVDAAIAESAVELKKLLSESLATCVKDQTFRDDVAKQVRSVLAKTLVQRFGGELEKQVNTLKSDPAMRARITVAIEDIVASTVVTK